MGDEQTIEVLRYARDVALADESQWTRGSFARDAKEKEVSPTDPTARSFCTWGANLHANTALGLRVAYKADTALEAVLDRKAYGCAADFNDDPDTTYEDVISLFDRAIKSLEDPS